MIEDTNKSLNVQINSFANLRSLLCLNKENKTKENFIYWDVGKCDHRCI